MCVACGFSCGCVSRFASSLGAVGMRCGCQGCCLGLRRHLQGLGNRRAVLVIAQRAASLLWTCPCRGSSFPCSCLVSRGGRCQPALVCGGRRGKAAVTLPGTGWILKGGSGSLVFWAWDPVRTVPTGGELERRPHSCRVDVSGQLLLLPVRAALGRTGLLPLGPVLALSSRSHPATGFLFRTRFSCIQKERAG